MNIKKYKGKWRGNKNCLQYRKHWSAKEHKSSMGEKSIVDALSAFNVKFIREIEFKNLNGHAFDFYIPNKGVIIEFDGEQHYSHNNTFDNGDYSLFIKRKNKDKLKNEFCRSNGLIMLRIKYTQVNNAKSIISSVIDINREKIKSVKRSNKDKQLIKRAKERAEKNYNPISVIDGKTYFRRLRKI